MAGKMSGKESTISKIFRWWMILVAIYAVWRIWEYVPDAWTASLVVYAFGIGIIAVAVWGAGIHNRHKHAARERKQTSKKVSVEENLDGALSWIGNLAISIFFAYLVLQGLGLILFQLILDIFGTH